MTTRTEHFDVAVIGAGVFGAWTAYRLRQSGASVILIDKYGAGNRLASSGGESRIMRRGYGPDEIYSRSADQSLEQWRQMSDRTGQPLFYRTGVLWLAREDDPYSVSTLATFERIGVAFEKFGRLQLSERYPQIQFGSVAWAIFEPDGGALMARRAVQSIVKEAEKDGITYLQDSILPPQSDGRLTAVLTAGGQRIEAGRFVFACGPWLPKVFPDLLDGIIEVTRQEVFYFAVSEGDSKFSPPAMPVW
ncbi:MAG TPA: FAD-dependent oxidoreductase, partial [Pyrinomonadaceae bacterium]|nr:FAD-dependent oxidoreductase [Pyrinomonadaceae bacterium]